jgi:hypothetical protein
MSDVQEENKQEEMKTKIKLFFIPVTDHKRNEDIGELEIIDVSKILKRYRNKWLEPLKRMYENRNCCQYKSNGG